MLVNRWRKVINNVIDREHHAFIPGRDISDAVLLVHEIWRYIKAHRNNKKQFFIAKLDMEKACDRVRWDFVELVLQKMGFCNGWIELNKMVATNFTSFIKWNGHYSEPCKHINGLRQGDPLSPILFNIITQALSSYIKIRDVN